MRQEVTPVRTRLIDWVLGLISALVWAAIFFQVVSCLTGCALDSFEGLAEPDAHKGGGRGEPADVELEADAGAPDASPGVEDASRPVEDASRPVEDAAQRPDAGPVDAGAPDAPPATLEGAWEVSAELEGAGCGLGQLDVLEWRVRVGRAIEQPPPDNALVWQEGRYQAASGGWAVQVTIELVGAELRGVLERRAPPQCQLERYQLHGVRP